MKQQTAVEFLENELDIDGKLLNSDFEFAKRLFQQQIKDAYDQGIMDFARYDPERHGNEIPKSKDYYTETFKQD